MSKNMKARHAALAKALGKPLSAFNCKEDLGVFTLIPPSGAGLVGVPIYRVFTPEEATREKEAKRLHGDSIAEAEVDGQVYLIFSNEKS